MKKLKQNCNNVLTVESLLKATPLDSEPDRAVVKYPKIKAWHRCRDKTTFLPTRRYRPNSTTYWTILKQTNRPLTFCEECHSDYRVTVHHKDGNCFNNELDNLSILCWNCHKRKHGSDDFGVVDEEEGAVDDS